MAVRHMMRSEGREGDFPTECGAVGNVQLTGDWAEVTCNNCIRKFGPKDAKDQYATRAKESGVKVQVSYTDEEKQVDRERMNLDGIINNLRSQQLRLDGIKMSIQALLDPMASINEESVLEITLCVGYLEAAMHNLAMLKGFAWTRQHETGEEVFPERSQLDEYTDKA
jgi:hypothetical protein